MSLILCIETSSTNCSVAIATDIGNYSNSFGVHHCLDLLEDQSDSYSHGERLHVFIDNILERNNLSSQDLDAVAISKGPGSYTGLRIGVASAKGLCFALSIPLISIDTLEALANQATVMSEVIIPMVDARRMEVYTTVYKNGEQLEPTTATILEKNTFEKYLSSDKVKVLGSGALKFQQLNGDSNNKYIERLPTALTMCDLAMEAYKKSDTVEDIAYYEPFYLKEFRSN